MTMTPAQRVEILRACCCIAGADGEATGAEREHLVQLADNLGVGDASLNAMIDRAEKDPDFYQQQFRILKDDPLECMDTMLKVLTANGSIKDSELTVLKGLAGILGISDEDFQAKVHGGMN